MRAALIRLLNSRAWVVISIGCALFAVYEGVEKLIAGDEIEGALDFVLMAVVLVNLINRFKTVRGYIDKLQA